MFVSRCTMYEMYPMYSTTQGNFFFQVDERSPCSYPKLTKEEIEEIHNDWFEGLRRLRDDDSRIHASVNDVEWCEEEQQEEQDEQEEEE